MLAGVLCVLVLLGALLVVRAGVASSQAGEAPWSRAQGRTATLLGAIAVLAGAFPLIPLLPWFDGEPSLFFGDALGHAHVARDIVRHGLEHGWIDAYGGGFPFGHHYPPLGWLLLAGALGLGLTPAAGVHLLGMLALAAAPLTLYFALVRAGARPGFALLGGLYLAWVSPYNAFVGGYEAFFQLGLFSQIVALPLCIVFAATVAGGRSAWPALAGALAMSAHPQLTVATVLLAGVAALASARRDAIVRALRGCLGAGVAGGSLYGQGIATMNVPFGWPPLGWRQIGFDSSRLDWWFLDGDLLDQRSDVPALTALFAAAVLTLLIRRQRPLARAALVATVSAVLLSVSGPALATLGWFGTGLLSVLQPLRVLALFPPLTAAVVVVALEESVPLVRKALFASHRARLAALSPWLVGLVVLGVTAAAAPERARYTESLASTLRRSRGASCPEAPSGYARATLSAWLSSLRGGRLWLDPSESSVLRLCAGLHGLELESAVPIGTTTGVGSHVGIHWLAFRRLSPERSGSDRRAEALGIRHLLMTSAPPPGWTERARRGDLRLLSHSRPSDLIGAGCITERWSGNDRALRARLSRDLNTTDGADTLLDPERFVVLEHTQGELQSRVAKDERCDASGVRIAPRAREPGALEAEIETRAPVDVVFRVTAFPTWRVFVDGVPVAPVELVAPGFILARVPAGRHRVEAVVSAMPGYPAILALGALLVAGIAVIRPEHWAAVRGRARRFLKSTS